MTEDDAEGPQANDPRAVLEILAVHVPQGFPAFRLLFPTPGNMTYGTLVRVTVEMVTDRHRPSPTVTDLAFLGGNDDDLGERHGGAH